MAMWEFSLICTLARESKKVVYVCEYQPQSAISRVYIVPGAETSSLLLPRLAPLLFPRVRVER